MPRSAMTGPSGLFLDFETVQFAVPIWKGTRPYQQIPFQFSLHRLDETRQLIHQDFLDLPGADPSLLFAQALVLYCASPGPIYVYNAAFERTRIAELADRFAKLRRDLLTLNERIVDLLPITRDHYYHPDQHGSWSIKAVLPTIAPDLSYEQLSGVHDGTMASEAYLEAIDPNTNSARQQEL